jgi:hypothetical protein
MCYGETGGTGAPLISTDWTKGAKAIANFYPGQQVQVLEYKDLLIDWQGVQKWEPMARLRPFMRADWGATFATHPYLVQTVTAVSSSNSYREKVKGTVYLPVSFGTDFTFAGNFVPANWWVMERWLA